MAPLIEMPESPSVGVFQKQKGHYLATTLVTKYLRTVVKSQKLANKFEEELNCIIKPEHDTISADNITLQNVLEKHLAGAEKENGKYKCTRKVLVSPKLKSVKCHYIGIDSTRYRLRSKMLTFIAGSAPTSAILPLLVYKHILENTSGKLKN